MAEINVQDDASVATLHGFLLWEGSLLEQVNTNNNAILADLNRHLKRVKAVGA